jgi:hypothetical protein
LGALCPAVYRPRKPRTSPLFRLVEECYEEVKGRWEERFEATYGRWRGFVDEIVYAFTDCGDLSRGMARVYCDACRSEYLLAFSCSRRGFCPSCAAKRGAIFGAFLGEELLEEVGHCMWALTIPKLLRPYWLHTARQGSRCASVARAAMGRPRQPSPSRAAWPPLSGRLGDHGRADRRSGWWRCASRDGRHSAHSVIGPQVASHLHALASRGGWDRDGVWHPVPYVDERAAELLFRQKVVTLLSDEGLLERERIELLDSWKSGHTGFSAHSPRGTRIARTPSERRRAERVKNRVTVSADDSLGLERLAESSSRSAERPATCCVSLCLSSGSSSRGRWPATGTSGRTGHEPSCSIAMISWPAS